MCALTEEAYVRHCERSRRDAKAAAGSPKALPRGVSLFDAMKRVNLDKVYMPCAKTGKPISIAEVLRDL